MSKPVSFRGRRVKITDTRPVSFRGVRIKENEAGAPPATATPKSPLSGVMFVGPFGGPI